MPVSSMPLSETHKTPAGHGDDGVELAGDWQARERGVRRQAQALVADVVDHDENAEAAPRAGGREGNHRPPAGAVRNPAATDAAGLPKVEAQMAAKMLCVRVSRALLAAAATAASFSLPLPTPASRGSDTLSHAARHQVCRRRGTNVDDQGWRDYLRGRLYLRCCRVPARLTKYERDEGAVATAVAKIQISRAVSSTLFHELPVRLRRIG